MLIYVTQPQKGPLFQWAPVGGGPISIVASCRRRVCVKAVDAIRKYLVEMQKSPADLKSLTIYDKYGHEIDGEAPLKDGDVIEVKAIKEEDTQCEANNPSVSLSIDSIKTPKLESDIVSTPAKIPFPNSKV